VRAGLAATAVVGGVIAELVFPYPLLGTCIVALFVPLVWYSAAPEKSAPRGPGTWLAVTRHEALTGRETALRPPSVFDPAFSRGKATLFVTVAVIAFVGFEIFRRSPYAATLALLDGVPFLALFATNIGRKIGVDPAVDAAPFLAKVTDRLELKRGALVRIIPRLRIPAGKVDPDEVRLLVLPKDPPRGLRGLEVAGVWTTGPGGHLFLPEILVRAQEGSPALGPLADLEPLAEPQRGRRPDEIVFSFAPKIPTAASTADLLMAITDRMRSPRAPANAPRRPSAAAPSAAPSSRRLAATPIPQKATPRPSDAIS
jgi:hypothetical protein